MVEGKTSGSFFSPASKHFASHDMVLDSVAVSQGQWERHWLYWMASCWNFFLLGNKLITVIWHATAKLEAMIQMPSTVKTTADSYQIQ